MQGLEIVRVGKGLPQDPNFGDHTPSRHEKSLGLLTTKFVTLLQEAKDGVLDLKLVGDLTRVVCLVPSHGSLLEKFTHFTSQEFLTLILNYR